MSRKWIILSVFAVQLGCAIFFVAEILLSVLGLPFDPIPWRIHELIEIGAAVGLIFGVVVGAIYLRTVLRRARRAESALRAASGAFWELMEERFEQWELTPAERDVAQFALRGMSLAEISGLRQTSEGTVKAQTAAIYRKAGVASRTELLGLFVEDLMIDGGQSPDESSA
ncbi:MAG: LuxR C-terminal-related transcriptional regulator [Pseudomonadota bacterium]